MKSVIAKNIKAIIQQQGYKQSAVAAKAGYAPGKFNNMLNSRKTITDCDILPIALALGVSPNDLFGLTGEKPNHDLTHTN